MQYSNLPAKAKALIFLGSATLVAGTATLIYEMASAESLREIFKSKNFTILTSSDSSIWTEILKDYTAQIKTQKELKIYDFEGGDNKIQEFQEKCKTILDLKYKIAVARNKVNPALWCVKQQKISDYLTKNKFTILNTNDTENTGDGPKWDKKIQEYLNNSDISNALTEITLTKSKENAIDSTEKKNFISACKKLIELKHFEKDFINSYKLASNWCSIKQEESKK